MPEEAPKFYVIINLNGLVRYSNKKTEKDGAFVTPTQRPRHVHFNLVRAEKELARLREAFPFGMFCIMESVDWNGETRLISNKEYEELRVLEKPVKKAERSDAEG